MCAFPLFSSQIINRMKSTRILAKNSMAETYLLLQDGCSHTILLSLRSFGCWDSRKQIPVPVVVESQAERKIWGAVVWATSGLDQSLTWLSHVPFCYYSWRADATLFGGQLRLCLDCLGPWVTATLWEGISSYDVQLSTVFWRNVRSPSKLFRNSSTNDCQ